ncbi:hypothetical protein D3C72_1946740 [compost metagenome]
MEGNDKSRCGSFARIGKPDAVFEPDRAQLLLPIPSSFCFVLMGEVIASSKEAGIFGIGKGVKFHLVPTGIIGSSLNG